jgi:DNA primase
VLFGLDQAKKGIRTAGKAVIVEGYMDVLMAHQYGIDNVVAQMGTALTEAQLRRLKRHTQQFILALDSDVAGDQATLRGLDVARQVLDREAVPVPTPRGLIRFEDQLAADIRIVSLPVGLDPDEVIRESPSDWAKLTAQAKPVMDYYFEALTADLDLSSAKGKAEAVRSLGPLILEIGDRVQRTHYLQQLARMVQVDERSLLQQIRQAGSPRPGPRRTRVAQPVAQEKTSLGLDEHCLAVVLTRPDILGLADRILLVSEKEPFRPDDLGRPDDRAILTAWRQWLDDDGSPDVRAEFFDTLDESLQARVNLLIEFQASQPPAPDDLFRVQILDAITRLRLRTLRRRSRELGFMQADMQSSGDREALRTYMQLNNELRVRIRQLEQALSERSISGRRQEEDASVRVLVSEE